MATEIKNINTKPKRGRPVSDKKIQRLWNFSLKNLVHMNDLETIIFLAKYLNVSVERIKTVINYED